MPKTACRQSLKCNKKYKNLIEECGICLLTTGHLKFEFEGQTVTERAFDALYNLPKDTASHLEIDDSPEDMLTIEQLKELSEYGYFDVFKKDDHHYVLVNTEVIPHR